MGEGPWAGTGGLSELLFSYFMLAIFISYVILLTWLRRERPTPRLYGPGGQRCHSLYGKLLTAGFFCLRFPCSDNVGDGRGRAAGIIGTSSRGRGRGRVDYRNREKLSGPRPPPGLSEHKTFQNYPYKGGVYASLYIESEC